MVPPTTSEAILPLTPRPLPSPQHGRTPSPLRSHPSGSRSAREDSPTRSAAVEDWWRWPTPTKEDATLERPFVEIGAGGAAQRQREDGGRVKMLGEWRVGTTVGRGTSGRVRLARSTLTGEFAAVKKVRRLEATDKHAEAIHREISMMKLVEHPHILQLRDVFETPTHFFLVTDYCPHGEVFHYLISHNLSPDTIYRWFAQLMSALSQLHLLGIAHRDVKFENLFLFKDEDGGLSLKLGDLGMASFQPDGNLLETSCGSPHYAAPEVIQGIAYDGMAADIWSSGIVLYALFARALPFDHDHVPTLLALIKRGQYEMDTSITGDARDLVQRMLVKDVVMRISLGEVLSHPYLTKRHGELNIAESSFPQESIGAPTLAADLEEDVLTNLKVVMRVKSMKEAEEMVLSGSPRARYFYSTLARFKTKMTVIPAEVNVRHSARMGRRRSVSMSDLSQLPRPSSLAVPSMEQMEDRPRSRRGRAGRHANEVDSAPAEVTAYAFPAPPSDFAPPKTTRRVVSQILLSSRAIADSENEEANSAPAQLLHFDSMYGPPTVDPFSLAHPASAGPESSSQSLTDDALSSSTRSKRSALSKKQSFPQRVKGFFKRDESISEPNKLSLEPISPAIDNLPPASPLRSSFLKRSTGYSSLHRAIVALSPSSPSPMRSSYHDELGTPVSGSSADPPQRKKSFARLLRSNKVADEPVKFTEQTKNVKTPTDENQSPFLQPRNSNSPSPSPTPSPSKRRPTPLNLLSSNIPVDSPPFVRSSEQSKAATAAQVLFGATQAKPAEGDTPVFSPRSPLSGPPSSNENDPFTLGSPFQPQPTNTIDRRPSRKARLRDLEDENSALKVEITLLLATQVLHQNTIDTQQKQIDELKAETLMLWRKVEQSLDGTADLSDESEESPETIKRSSLGDESGESKYSQESGEGGPMAASGKGEEFGADQE